jgi:TonB family protein
MKVSSRFLLALALAAIGLGCASDEARRDAERARRKQELEERHSHIQAASDEADDASPEMTVAGDEGTLNAADIESAIDGHRAELLDCYRLGRRSSRRPGGRALLRFFVDGKGEVVDVAILESTIGNGAVERCLADIAVGVTLPPPSGRKPMSFDYPVEFRIAAARR